MVQSQSIAWQKRVMHVTCISEYERQGGLSDNIFVTGTGETQQVISVLTLSTTHHISYSDSAGKPKKCH